MKPLWIALAAFGVFHTLRDVLQLLGVKNALTTFLHWNSPHPWINDYTSAVFHGALAALALWMLRRR